ncbi:hypothetical protein CYLTODRAFT_421402 [Cylindrobasidium torrendii FP15055 ss-10]|uniref:BTB domain-containing protein n=1 Tax=Cylindrobasidium torrendii FP15055 ss-10 TaxID=1314674 RepID=A0A0D7BEU1_9AGAR|nr:hypothetical protein CYLTODRAFT_421402 [Cylindrobasidium torrendii FP15055 ss-10]
MTGFHRLGKIKPPSRMIQQQSHRKTQGDGVYTSSRFPLDLNLDHQVSRTFHPDAHILGTIADLVLISSDDMHFHVHSFAISHTLHDSRIRHLDEEAAVLNIILHTVYNISCAIYAPTFDDISVAVERMPAYGMSPREYITPSSPTFELLLSHASARPLDVYALAAERSIFELAVSASSYLTRYDLMTLDDDLCARIGSTYLARLHNLQLSRIAALKQIIIAPPDRHPDSLACNSRDQEELYAGWARAVALTLRDAKPGISANLLVLEFRLVGTSLSCQDCLRNLDQRIQTISRQWTNVKATI